MNWKPTLILGVIGALSLLLAACGGAAAPAAPAPAPQAPAAAPAAPAAPAPAAPQAPAAPAAPAPAAAAAAPAAPVVQAVAAPQTFKPTAVPVREAPAMEEVVKPSGTLVLAITSVNSPSGFPTDCLWCASLTVVSAQESLLQTTRGADGGITAAPWLAKSWETAPDFSYTDFILNEGIQFHRGWGELTAEDVKWTYHALMPSFTEQARHDSSAEIDLAINNVEPIDTYTARFHWDAFAGHTLTALFTDANEGTGIFPKIETVKSGIGVATDEEANEWMRTNITGTGSFEMDGWVVQDGMYLTAFTDHWEKVPFVEQVRIREVPEASTRRAMLESGEAQIAGLALKDWPALLGSGLFAQSPEGSKNIHGFPFGGNYWEWTFANPNSPEFGQDLPETLRDTSLPWIGDPYENSPGVFDENTPSMQRSLKVRRALSMSIDREGINEAILNGLGTPQDLGGQWDTDPVWLENQDKWRYGYNIEEAKKLLDEAGYGDGFEVHFWAGLSGEDVEMSEAIAADWLNSLNIQSTHDRRTYSTIRPSLVTRTFPVLRMHGCCGWPGTWPIEFIWSSYGRGGYNDALELPKASEVNGFKQSNTDPVLLKEAAVEMRQYLYDWALRPAIVASPGRMIYDVNAVESWNMRPFLQFRHDGIHDLEWVKLK